MKLLIFLVACLFAYVQATSIRSREHIESLSPEHVEYINQLNTTWRAGHNFKGYKIHQLKGLCGTIIENMHEIPIQVNDESTNANNLPIEFDSRKRWPECADVISHIRDQASCGSCWAVSVAGAVTDRSCIATGGKNKTLLSAQQITSCCTNCFEKEGCQGGYPIQAWAYWVREGLVTGGDYGDKTTCQSYLIPPCEHHVEGKRPPCGNILPTPKCSKKCINDEIEFESDKTFGRSAFNSGRSVGEIKTELAKRGPMTTNFVVYDDFFLYKEGVYQVTKGAKPLGGHAIVVIGWGETKDGIQYWIAKNSWNTDWGNKGYFNIRIGAAGINTGFAAGIAKASH